VRFLLLILIPALSFAQTEPAADAPESEAEAEEAPAAPPPPLWPEELGPLPVQAAPHPLPGLSAQVCNACHGAVHDQWAGSGHATASSDPVWQQARTALGDPPLCNECHLPLQAQRTEVPRGPGGSRSEANPAWDPGLATEGVTCVACHLRGDAIVGPRELPAGQAPHKVRYEPALSTAEACAFCHQAALPGAEETPFLDTVGEWRASPFGAAGVPCQDCHMPRTSGAIAGSRFAAFGAHGTSRTEAALGRAITLNLDVNAPRLQRGQTLRATATVQNTGAGHAVPTGDPSHRLEVRFELLDGEDNPVPGVEAESVWLGREMAAEAPFAEVSDTRLQPGAERTFDFVAPLSKKATPGRWTLVVSVRWWPASPERLTELGLGESVGPRVMTERRIPVRVE